MCALAHASGLNTQRVPVALPAADALRLPMAASGLNAQRAPVALPATQRVPVASRPPDPLQVMLTQKEYTGTCLWYAKTCIRCCQLNIAQEHAHHIFGTPMHRIRVPRDEVPGRECRGRGRPLPPPAQGTCTLFARCPCRPPRRRTARILPWR